MPNLIILNYSFVLFFGIALTLSFVDIGFKKNTKLYFIIFTAFGLIQAFVYFTLGYAFLYKSYPLFIHFPLFLLLKCYYKNSTYISAISVLSAYLFCTPRKWIGTFISQFFNYNENISYFAQIAITIPLLLLITKYLSPHVRRLRYEDNRILMLFSSVPLFYYILEYILTVYTSLLHKGGIVLVEFMDSAIVVLYFIFSIIYLKTLYKQKEIEVEQSLLKLMIDQSQSEIDALRISQKQAAIYRHDLRHHLYYLNACISENKLHEATSYIAETCGEIDNSKVIPYSGNESINLILSSYATKAEYQKIDTEITVSAYDFNRFTVSDLCSLFSNALENAIHACGKIKDCNRRYIKLRVFSRNNKLCIDIRNSYQIEPVFRQDHPISNEANHGFGTKSMVYVIEKYVGVYRFFVQDGEFIFQATI